MKIFQIFSFISIYFFTLVLSFAYTVNPYPDTPPKAVLKIVFCPLNYPDNPDFIRDIGICKEKLSRVKPFSGVKDHIGFYYVKLSKPEQDNIFKPVSGFPPLKVRQDFIDNISAHLKSEYKLVIVDAQGWVTCAELSQAQKTSLLIVGKARYNNSNSFAKGFLHELGHSFGLQDEGLYPEAGRQDGGFPNCARNRLEAQGWWGDLVAKDERVSYIAGCCGNKDYIRPTIASLMNDAEKAEDFGPVNERYLRQVLSEISEN